MSLTCNYLGKTIAWRDIPQLQWIVQGFVRREHCNLLLIVSQHDSRDSALMPYDLFLEALDAGIILEQAEAVSA